MPRRRRFRGRADQRLRRRPAQSGCSLHSTLISDSTSTRDTTRARVHDRCRRARWVRGDGSVDLGSLLEGFRGLGGGASLLAVLTVFVQEAGVPLPLPIGGVLLYLGYRATSQPLVLLGLTVLMLELATVLGASAKYWIGLKGGRPLLHSYGHFVRLKEERLQLTERRFRDHGARTVLLGRTLPGITMIMPLAAGAL